MLVQLLLVLLLLFIVIGLLLPQSYNVTKSININANTHIVKPLITDFSQWHKWSPWKKLDPSVELSLGEPSTGVGAHQSWQSKWGAGEMTTTALSANKMVLNILFAQEHIIAAKVIFTQNAKTVTVTFQITGQATLPLVSGYVAVLSEHILSNAVSLGLNNLKTVAQLSDAQTIMESHGSQNRTSKN